MIDKLIFQELTDAEAANLTGGVTVVSFTTVTEEGETEITGVLSNGFTFEAEEPEAPEQPATPVV